MADSYTKAVLDLIKANKDFAAIFDGLIAVLEKRDHKKLLPIIVRQLERQLSASINKKNILHVARLEDVEKFSVAINAATTTLKIEGDVATIIDKTLIGGFVLNSHHSQIDQSYKAKLLNLYQSITT